MPGEARSHRDGRDKCLRMVQAASGVLEVGSGWVFQAVFYCPASCAASDEMCGISPEHPPTAWPQTASSSCVWDVAPIPNIPAPLWSFPELGEEESGPRASPAALSQSHTLSKPGSSAVPSYWNGESDRLLPIGATSLFDFWL